MRHPVLACTASITVCTAVATGGVQYTGVTVSHQSPGGTTWTEPVPGTTGSDVDWDFTWSDEWETLNGQGSGSQSSLVAQVSTEADFASAASTDLTFTLTEAMTLNWSINGLDPDTYNFAALWHDDGNDPPFWNYDGVDLVFGHGGQIDEPGDWQTSGTAILGPGNYAMRLWAGWGNSGLYTMSATLGLTPIPAPASIVVLALAGCARRRRRS